MVWLLGGIDLGDIKGVLSTLSEKVARQVRQSTTFGEPQFQTVKYLYFAQFIFHNVLYLVIFIVCMRYYLSGTYI